MATAITSVVRAQSAVRGGGGGAGVLAVCVLFCGILNGAARAQCIDYETIRDERLVGEVALSGFDLEIRSVAVAGDIAILGGFQNVPDEYLGFVQVVDIADPGSAAVVGWLNLAAAVDDVAVSGHHAYVTTESALHVVDITYPWRPLPVGELGLPAGAGGLAVRDGYAFVADGEAGLLVIDVADPALPLLRGWVNTFGHEDSDGDGTPDRYTLGRVRDVALGQRYVIATSSIGLLTIDATDPAEPRIAHHLASTALDGRLSLAGDRALVTTARGVQPIDVADPLAPQLLERVEALDAVSDIALSGDHAFAADERAGLQVIALADPQRPRSLWLPVPGRAHAVALSGDLAYVADADRLRIVDIGEPDDLPPVGALDFGHSAGGIAISDDHAYLAVTAGLAVVDLADPLNPRLVADAYTPGISSGVAVAGTHAYIADGYAGLQVIDIADPGAPRLVGAVATAAWAHGVALAGSYAFVATSNAGLQVIDVSEPTDPRPVGLVATPGNAEGVVIGGNLAYVTGEPFVLHVIDIADPLAPQPLGVLAPSAGWWDDYAGHDIALAGDYAYVVHRYGKGLVVVDVSTPTNPLAVTEIDVPGWGIAVHGAYAYVANPGADLQVLEIADPASPRRIGSFHTRGTSADVAVHDGRMYVTGAGLSVAPLQCESALAVFVADLQARRDGRQGVVSWSVSQPQTGVEFRIWREAAGQARTLLGEATPTAASAYRFVDLAAPDGAAEYWLEIVAADADATWYGPAHLTAATLPAVAQLRQNRPNPFNPRTSLQYSLPQAGHVTLVVHDMLGRRVATLLDAVLAAGEWTAEWDGLDDHRLPAPSGLYVARLQTPDGVRSVKMTLAR